MEVKKTPTWLIALCVIIGIIGLGILVSTMGDSNEGGGSDESGKDQSTQDVVDKSSIDEDKSSGYTVNKPFKFDDLEITISDQIGFVKNTNEFSDEYDKDVVKIPVTVKNLKDESHDLNIFYINVFGPNGTEVKDQSTYFDDSIFYGGKLMPGASFTTYLYYVYDGDGKYNIEFDNYAKKIDVELNVIKQ